jgi:hemerythrin superfamily protein
MSAPSGGRLIKIKLFHRALATIGRMNVASDSLAAHHRRCEELFAAAQRAATASDWKRLPGCVAELREALLDHFRYEEERLFPLYEQTSGNEGATETFCAQHDDMRAALWILATMSAAGEPKRYREELGTLQAQFDAHAEEEERRMYPEFERVLKR